MVCMTYLTIFMMKIVMDFIDFMMKYLTICVTFFDENIDDSSDEHVNINHIVMG